MFTRGIICLLLFTCLPAQADNRFPGIHKLMTEEELRASGVDQLTEQQIQALNQWLIRYTANEAQLVEQTPEVKKAQQETFQPVKSRILGEFHGWSGKTLFHLENGQVWQQRYNDRWVTQLENPEVEISRNILGFYHLEVISKKRRIGIKRIK